MERTTKTYPGLAGTLIFFGLLGNLLAQPQNVITWPPLQGLPGLVYASTTANTAKFEPVILGPGISPPVKGAMGWFLNVVNIPPAINSGFIPLVLASSQPADGTERWCYSITPNLDITVDGVLITRTINPAAVKETILVTSFPPISSAGTYSYDSFTVVSPGPILDGSGNEIKIVPYWSRSDQACPGGNPGIILSALVPTVGTTYARTKVLILANW